MLSVRNGFTAIAFYKKAFDAIELMRYGNPDGTGHVVAEMQIDQARFFLSDESPEYGNFSHRWLIGRPP